MIFGFIKQFIFWILIATILAGGMYTGVIGLVIGFLGASVQYIYSVLGVYGGSALLGIMGIFTALGFATIFKN